MYNGQVKQKILPGESVDEDQETLSWLREKDLAGKAGLCLLWKKSRSGQRKSLQER